MKHFFIYSMLFLTALSFAACSDSDETQTDDIFFILPTKKLEFKAIGETKEIALYTNIQEDFQDIVLELDQTELEWCEVKLVENKIQVTTQPNYFEQPRATVLTIRFDGIKRQIGISQEKSTGSEDILIKIEHATATSEETEKEDRGIKYTYDQDYQSYFNSKFGEIKEWPFEMEYTLAKNTATIDYFVYHPRTDSGNKWGSFIEYKVFISTTDNPNKYTEVAHITRDEADIFTPNTVKLDAAVKNPAKVKFEIYSALNNRVSCAEMEFFQMNEHKFDYTAIFQDPIFSELKENITEKELAHIPDTEMKTLATQLLNKEYNKTYRVASFRPYQHPSVMAQINKTEQYSLRDNPTGIYFEENDKVTIAVGDTHGNAVSLVVQDLMLGYNKSKTYLLKEGLNKINITDGGLGYLLYHVKEHVPLVTTDKKELKKIEDKSIPIHFIFGKVNGYFDATKQSNDDWVKLIDQAKFTEIDVLGKYAHVTWAVEDYKSFQTKDILTIINNVDKLVLLEQQFMGLEKYDKMFNNRLYFHINYASGTAAARNHTFYARDSFAEVFCDPTKFATRIWGPGHEVGHINQTRPGLKWTGTTEVTNNILAMYVQTQFGQKAKILADNIYQQAREKIVDTKEPHSLNNLSNEFYYKLVPFWQLKLYLMDACGQDSFYKDLYEHYRVTDDLDTSVVTQGIIQLEFVKQVCRISGYNLLDFFEKWGFLRPVDRELNDYGVKRFKITQEQIDAVIKEVEAANYKMPHDNIHLIDETNIANYK